MNQLEEKLVTALRSGTYRQGRERLRAEDEFCCLGVACEVSKVGKWCDGYGYLASKEQPRFSSLPDAVRDALGWATCDGRLEYDTDMYFCWTLAHLNDAGLTFDQIADCIEAGLVSKSR